MKARVLLTGSSGFIGNSLIDRLDEYDLSLLNRTLKTSVTDEHRVFRKEINSAGDYRSALLGCNYVIHCAARVHVMNGRGADSLEQYRDINTLGTINLARQASASGVKRFIFISSVKVNGESTSNRNPFTESDIRAASDFYGQSKSEAEELLLELAEETGLEIVIIRPTLVYGPGVKANFSALMKVVSKGFPLPFGCINTNLRSLVSVDNLVDLIITCIKHPKASNQVFLVSDDHDVSTLGMVQEMAKALGRKNWQIPVPIWCFKVLGKLLNKESSVDRLVGSLQVDISHTKETLNWYPPQTLSEGFEKTANWFLKSKLQDTKK
ncbi:UDP-glucose 4-epimerase family protein [Vibrio rhodolitus]|uniref:UDP-glucose 4-epimerase family protein n=1 Tax=Vibrio rhodolitus TaxID=2231649 RepID=UPI000E0B6863|nr:SDR family oxidoreductase [Vibrio rhodolitus]